MDNFNDEKTHSIMNILLIIVSIVISCLIIWSFMFNNIIINKKDICYYEKIDQISLHLMIFGVFITFSAVVASILGFFGWRELKSTAKTAAENTATLRTEEIYRELNVSKIEMIRKLEYEISHIKKVIDLDDNIKKEKKIDIDK